jgi:hypothetical protein
MNKSNYYLTQLEKLKKSKEYNLKVKFFDSENNFTNCLDLNPESIEVITKFLEQLKSEANDPKIENLISELNCVTEKLIQVMTERGQDESKIKLYTDRALKIIASEAKNEN